MNHTQIKNLAHEVLDSRAVLLEAFESYIQLYGMRESSRILGANLGNLHRIRKGEAGKLETIAEYVLKFSELQSKA